VKKICFQVSENKSMPPSQFHHRPAIFAGRVVRSFLNASMAPLIWVPMSVSGKLAS